MFRAALASALLLCLLGGCATYQLGETANLEFRSVFVAPPANQTSLPQLAAPVAAAMRRSIEQSASLDLASRSDADAELRLRLVESGRERLAVQSQDLGRARKIDLQIEVSLSLLRSGSADQYIIRDRRFTISQEVYLDSGQIEAEAQATPELARKIAQAAADILLDPWP